MSAAQGVSDQKKKRFGSSLKRLKWDPTHRRAIDRTAGLASKAEETTLSLKTLLAVFEVLVTDQAGAPIAGLSRDDFQVSEEGEPQRVEVFTRGDDAALPRSVILVLDYSGSQAAYLDASVVAAKTLIAQLGSADEMAIVTDDVELLVDFTRGKEKLVAALESIRKRAIPKRKQTINGLPVTGRRGRDLQFSALFASLRELVKNDGVRPIIIFQTDGSEAPTFRDQPNADDYLWNMPNREYGLADIFAEVQRSRATIYTIIPGEPLIGLPDSERYPRGRKLLEQIVRARFQTDQLYRRYAAANPLSDGQVRLMTDRFVESQTAASRVADLSGGWTAFLNRPEDALPAYRRILSDVNQRYVVGYYPTNSKRDGKLRRVRIKVRGHPEYQVHGRDSYYAPTQ